VIYVDTSVLLARLLAEDRSPPDAFWSGALVGSRLLQYETWTRIHARGAGESHGDAARNLLGRVAFLELAPPVLERALEPFPTPVRTLDALHLASACFLRDRDRTLEVATYDDRFASAAEALGLPVVRP
jgi:predicted nucleic acid-binding protein